MKRIVPVFLVPLILATGLSQGDTRLPIVAAIVPNKAPSYAPGPLSATLTQAPAPRAAVPPLRGLPPASSVSRYVRPPQALGDIIPHTYLVFGLRTGPGGMAFTDRNGAAIPVPSEPKIILGPATNTPAITLPLPRTFTLPYSALLPVPKK